METIFQIVRKNKFLRKLYGSLHLAPLYHWSFSFVASLRYPLPKNLVVIGITGTKGKTTTVELLNAILEAGGAKTALLSSVRVKVANATTKNMTSNSMPGRLYLRRFLARAAAANCTYAILEVTSEGVRLHRHRFIPWRAAVFTNLAPEHIESHGSFENYRDAKGSFLAYVAQLGGAVFLNGSDEHAVFYERMLRGVRPDADIVMFSGTDGLEWIKEAKTADPAHDFFLEFNRENAAAARAVALRLGFGDETVRAGLESFMGVPGRVDFVQTAPFAAVVDYAHTPDSLMKTYAALRESSYRAPKGRLICVLGSCGGGRDKWKRPIMGRIAAEYCDEIILTNEDPYDEPPERITQEIAAGFGDAQNTRFTTADSYRTIIDRRAALEAAVRSARPGDIVIATGKV